MSERNYTWKVGLFVAIGLALLGGLLLTFSKGLSVFTPTYKVSLKATSVGGLKKNANVLLSGVPVGRVVGFDVAPDGKGVLIYLSIESRYKDRIRGDARFSIQQQGLLGDQYVDISPQENKAAPIEPGVEIKAEEPFSFQETARSAKDLIELGGETLTSLNRVIERIDRTILGEQSLTNVSGAMDKFRKTADEAGLLIRNLNGLIDTNSGAITASVSNLVRFSQDMDRLSAEMNAFVATNRVEITAGVKSLHRTAETLHRLAQDVEDGKGAAGLMLRDPEFRQQISNVASNLQLFSYSVTQRGLLRSMFFKPKPPEKPKEKKDK